jgi:hypothetical protein
MNSVCRLYFGTTFFWQSLTNALSVHKLKCLRCSKSRAIGAGAMLKVKSSSIKKSALRDKAEKVPVDLSTLPPWGSIRKALSGAEFQVIEP